MSTNRTPLILVGSIAALLLSQSAQAVTKTWANAGGGDYNTTGNWTGGTPTSADVGLFNIATGNVTLSSAASVGSLNFDTNVSSFTLGTTGGPALTVTTGGKIEMLSTLLGTGKTVTVNAPIILGSGAAAVAYAFNNNATSATNALVFGGQISGGTTALSTLTLGGTNTGSNSINGNIVDGSGSVAVTKSGAGTWTMAGSANSYTGATTVTVGTLNLTGSLTGATAITVNGGTFTQSSGGVISGTGASLSVSSGTATLNGANSYTGATSLSSTGTLNLGNAGALGTGTFTMSGGTLINTTGAAMTLTSVTPIVIGAVTLGSAANTGGNGDINFGTNVTSYSGVFTDTLLGNGATFRFNGAVSNSAANSIFTVNGAGNTLIFGGSTLTLQSSINVNSGTTWGGSGNVTILGTAQNGPTVTASIGYSGTGTFTLAGANTYTGSTSFNSGSVILDYTSNAGTKISGVGTGGNFTLGGSVALSLNGGAVTETVNGITLNAGANSISRTAGSTGKIVGTTLTRTAGSTLALSAGGVLSTTTGSANSLFTSTAGVVGVVGGNDWAAKDAGNTNVVGFSTVGSYQNSTASTVSTGNQTDVVTNVTLAAAGSTSTLRFNSANTRTIDATGQTLTLSQGGILVTPAVLNNLTTITGGTLKAGSNNALFVFQNNTTNGLTIASTIADGSAASALTKSGGGLLTLSNTSNSYTGKTYLNQGTLNIAADTSLGVVPGAAVVDQLTMAGGTLQFGANNITLAANRGITLIGAGNTIDTNGNDATIAGIIAGSGVPLIKTGNGTLFLTGTNSFNGGFTIKAGIVNGAVFAGTNANSSIGKGITAADLVLDGGTIQYTGSTAASTVRLYTLGTNGGGFDASGTSTGSLTFSGNMTTAGNTGAQTFTLTGTGTGTAAGTISGTINNGTGTNVTSLAKTGTGTWNVAAANTYTGNTSVTGGVLNVTGSIVNNSSAKVFVDSPDATTAGNPVITRSRAITSGYAGFGATAGLVGGASTATKADLLGGTNSTGTDTKVSMAFREALAGDTTAGVKGSILVLTDMANSGASTGQTDTFVLQLSYDQAILGASEASLTAGGNLYLAYFNGTTWVNAIAGDFGSNTGSTNLSGSWAANGSSLTLGTWGVDIVNDNVWAVVNHNTDFSVIAAVPEPSTWVAVIAGMGILISVQSSRRRRMN